MLVFFLRQKYLYSFLSFLLWLLHQCFFFLKYRPFIHFFFYLYVLQLIHFLLFLMRFLFVLFFVFILTIFYAFDFCCSWLAEVLTELSINNGFNFVVSSSLDVVFAVFKLLGRCTVDNKSTSFKKVTFPSSESFWLHRVQTPVHLR